MDSINSSVETADGLPYYNFRKGNLSWEDFLKGFTENPKPIKTALRPLTSNLLADLFAEVERKEVRVEAVFMNAWVYSDIRKWGRDILTAENQKEELQKGLMARVWGAYLIVTINVPDKTVIVTSEEDKKICSVLELDQEEYYKLEGINALKNEAAKLTRELTNVYAQMEEMVNRALDSLKK